jgi:hypothetical protein
VNLARKDAMAMRFKQHFGVVTKVSTYVIVHHKSRPNTSQGRNDLVRGVV